MVSYDLYRKNCRLKHLLTGFFLAATLHASSQVAATVQLPAGTQHADDPEQVDAVNQRIQAAESALEKGDFASAVTMLKALAADRPKDARVLYDLGYAQERTGDDDAAARSYTSAIAADPALAEPRVALGLLDARAQRTAKAHDELAEAAALPSAAPDLRARAYRALATMDATSNPGAARDELLSAVKLGGEQPSDVELGAKLAAQSGDPADAESVYRRTLTADPTNIDAAVAIAPLLEHNGKTGEAESLLKTALEAHPGDPRLIAQLAAVYGSEDKPEQGIDLLQSARAADPQLAANDAATRMLARLDTMAGKDADALPLYQALVAKKNDDPALLDEYGDVLVKLARFNEAETVLSRSVAMKAAFATPQDWAEAAGHLAFAADRNHDPKMALQALAARATVLPNSPASLFLEATAHDALHQYKDAIKSYRAFLAMAGGQFPDQEFQARHRLVALEHEK